MYLEIKKENINKKAYVNTPAVNTGAISSGLGNTSPITEDKIKNGAVTFKIKEENFLLKSLSM